MSDPAAPILEPRLPEYAVEWHPEFEMHVVTEEGFALCYCPEKGSALFIAQACRVTRRAVAALAKAHTAARHVFGVLGLN